jgi:hypothetical protein
VSEKSSTSNGIIKNPLTVIAVFAGLAEVSATIALPQLDIAIQSKFVWFVMLFPVLLVVLFFLMLWFKHQVLYAPSDFSDESNFMKHWVPSPKQQLEEIMEEAAVQEFDGLAVGEDSEAARANISSEATPDLDHQNNKRIAQKSETTIRSYQIYAEAREIEDLLIRKLSSQLGLMFHRDVALAGVPNVRYDAVAETSQGPIMIEVKRASSTGMARHIARRELERAALFSLNIKNEELRGGKLIIGIVIVGLTSKEELRSLLYRLEKEASLFRLPIAVEFQVFTFDELKKWSQP